MNNPYKTLEVSRNANQGEIKKAYFKLIKKFPPEKEPERFKIIRAAYDSLKTASKKAETDVFILKEPEETFVYPDETEQSSNNTDINNEDILNILIELYTDLNKIEFERDYNEM